MSSNHKQSLLLNVSTTNLNVTDTSDFEIIYPSIALDEGYDYTIALRSYSLWYSWRNISAELGNNEFRYSTDGGITFTILTIPDGNYGIADINTTIKNLVEANGDDKANISIVGNYSTLKVDITLIGSYVVRFLAGGLHNILGFNLFDELTAGTTSSSNKVNITNDVDAIAIHTTLIDPRSNLVNDRFSTCIHQFVPTSGPGSNLAQTIPDPVYLPLNVSGGLNRARFSIKDQNGNALNMNGETATYSFHILGVKRT